MSFTWATVDRDFSDRPTTYIKVCLIYEVEKSITILRKLTMNTPSRSYLGTLQSHFIFIHRGDCQWSDLTNGGLFNQSKREGYQIIRYKGVILL